MKLYVIKKHHQKIHIFLWNTNLLLDFIFAIKITCYLFGCCVHVGYWCNLASVGDLESDCVTTSLCYNQSLWQPVLMQPSVPSEESQNSFGAHLAKTFHNLTATYWKRIMDSHNKLTSLMFLKNKLLCTFLEFYFTYSIFLLTCSFIMWWKGLFPMFCFILFLCKMHLYQHHTLLCQCHCYAENYPPPNYYVASCGPFSLMPVSDKV